MPYLQTILDAEEQARTVREKAEREAATIVSEKRMEVAERFEALKLSLDVKRSETLTEQKVLLNRAYDTALAQANDEAKRLVEQVRPREAQAIARIRARILDR